MVRPRRRCTSYEREMTPRRGHLRPHIANNLILSTNDQKLRANQNKGLSHDRGCGVPNTFPTSNKLPNPRIKIFYHPFILGKK